jgi:hypothetical protein
MLNVQCRVHNPWQICRQLLLLTLLLPEQALLPVSLDYAHLPLVCMRCILADLLKKIVSCWLRAIPFFIFLCVHAAAITKDINDTELMLASLLTMSGGSGGGNGAKGVAAEAAEVETRVGGLVQECLGHLPAPFDIEEVGSRFPVTYGQSLNVVLVQEMARYNKLCAVIRDSLRSMSGALQGLLVMSSELEAAYKSISLNQVGYSTGLIARDL